jgi:hypothetical protein
MDFPDNAVRAMHGNRILGKIAAFLPEVRDSRLVWLSLGFRPMPTDEPRGRIACRRPMSTSPSRTAA